MEISTQDRQHLQRLEEGLWRTETRFDRAWMERVLAPGFFEFGRSGRAYSREETLAIPARPIDARFPLTNFDTRLLGPDVVQATYTSIETYDGEEQVANRSSIWLRTGDGWRLLFHQATPIPD
ncbi:MAG: DUF4440 domain-containing protein [Chloroflexota bacterium]|nr:DUF4440 domain-containing protein [Chloroflexota bacterium]MDE2883934.1 DUF4440 domain-containing protein [Chloroflexota bacterium]